jgi:hypothetical protein
MIQLPGLGKLFALGRGFYLALFPDLQFAAFRQLGRQTFDRHKVSSLLVKVFIYGGT